LSVTLALAASSVYWLKFVTEMSWLRNTKYANNHFFDYSHNFLLTADWFGEKQLWFINFIFLTLVLITAGAFFAALFSGAAKQLRAPFALVFFALAMCVVVSKPVWVLVPFLPEVQFPWRWLTIVSAAGALVFAGALPQLANQPERLKNRGSYVKAFAAAALLGALGIYALMWFEFSLNHVPARDYEAYVAEKSAALGGEWFWTSRAAEDAFKISEKVVAGDRSVEIQSWQPTERVFTIAEGAAREARVATLFYPHWTARVNGALVAPQIAPDGALLIAVPNETARIAIRFEEPERIVAARYVSIFAWFLLLGGAIFIFARRSYKNIKTVL
jgi:hypothetical protein